MKRWIEHGLNVRPGDLGRGTLLSACLFLVISSYKIGGVAASALFLSRFQARQLAYADIASSILVAVAVMGYISISRRMILRDLLAGSMAVFAATYALFWGLAHYYPRIIWISPALYVWVKAFGVLGATQIWSLANYILTTREAKRVIGIVGGGAVAGGIFAGFLSKFMAKKFGTESLLLAVAVLVFLCAWLVIFVWRSSEASVVDGQEIADKSNKRTPKNLLESLRLLFSSPYSRAIAAVICISSLITTLTKWQFLAISQQFLVKKDVMAIFFGDFTFYVGILGLLFQLLLTSRILRRFHIGTALFVLPVTVLLGSVGLLALGTLGAAVALMGSDQILRYSLDKSTTEILYLPIATRVKLQVKWVIDTLIWRLGDGLSGLIVLIFATWLHLSARHISWVVVVLAGGWIMAVSVARRLYLATLTESIQRHRVDVEQATTPVLDRSTVDLLTANLSESDPEEILYALSLFEMEQQRAAHPAIRDLLNHSAPAVRQKAIAILASAGDRAVVPEVQRLLRDPALGVRTEALLFLSHQAHLDPLAVIEELGEFPDFSVRSAVVAFLAQPGEAQNLEAARNILDSMVSEKGPKGLRSRVEAARLLGELPDRFDPLLSRLLADPDRQVVCEAIRSIGMLRKRRLVPELLERIGHDKSVVAEAVEALGRCGDSVVGVLRDHLGDPSVPIEVRRAIPDVLAIIGTTAAASALQENLLESDSMLRFRTIAALNKLRRLHPAIELDLQLLETVLAAEILGHYRSYQILDSLGAAAVGDDPMSRALKESLQHEQERIFRLLGLLHPHLDLHSAYVGLQSSNASVHDNALEFLDNTLRSQMRDMLVPLLDAKFTVAERAQLAERLVRIRIENKEQAVAALVGSEDSWLRSCGAYAIGILGMKSLEGELNRCLHDADPLLRETAQAAKLRLQEDTLKA
ncbi:MAG TPA: Npt1/Npt2 family nucleotide transporter [Candidatus Eisenbacteria bacterium]|nr:Npt1/Npt2 family nucleotide transporter [Candidatus Eisenbacteria bacterium]